MQLKNMLKILKLHTYNIFRQYSELKYLKQNLKSNGVILSVDFSCNYNKRKHEIKVHTHRYEAVPVTAACYSNECFNDQKTLVRVSYLFLFDFRFM